MSDTGVWTRLDEPRLGRQKAKGPYRSGVTRSSSRTKTNPTSSGPAMQLASAMRTGQLLVRQMRCAKVTRKEDAGRATGPRERAREGDDATSRRQEKNFRARENRDP
ncbi:MAG: hypothetical protein M1815_004488 [Lichina confinis]|nr:MAG: hypothetical protein M1815_004488 [Lichina confinis]